MCLRPKSLTLAMPLHWLCIIIYHIYGKLRNLRTTDKFEWLLNSRTHCQYDKWDIHKMMFTSYCLTILQDAGSGCDWVWLETVFWLELDNAWSSPPSSGAVMFCMADITPPVGILSTIFMPILQYISPYSICCLQYISPYSICFLQYLKQGPSSMDATELLMDPLKKRNIALHWILNCLGIGIANYPPFRRQF